MTNRTICNFAGVFFLTMITLAACDKSPQQGSKSDKNTVSLDIPQVVIPAGEFIRGSDKEDDLAMRQQYGFPAPLYVDEHPQKKIYLDAYKIDTYEVSNKQYKAYLFEKRQMLPNLWMSNGYAITREQLEMLEVDKLRKMATDVFFLDMDTRVMDKSSLVSAMMKKQTEMDNFPVTGVNWFAAKNFCEWRNGRLPTEAEWEKAARGPDGLEYPWGNEWNPKITNTGDDGKWEEGVAPVGSYKGNQSPYGVYDMSGNVWEWVNDWYEPYEGSSYKTEAFGKHNRVLRGGGGGVGHYAISYFFRGATRQFSEPEMESEDVGFRCASDM